MKKWMLGVLVVMVVCHFVVCCFAQEESEHGPLMVSGIITTLDLVSNKFTLKDKNDKVFEFILVKGSTIWKCVDNSGGVDEMDPSYLAVGMDVNVEYAVREDGKLNTILVEIPYVNK